MDISHILGPAATREQVDLITKQIRKMPRAEQVNLLKMFEKHDEESHLKKCREQFIPFVKEMWPGFIQGRHHEIIGEAFERVISGKCKRLMINMPPRCSKSELTSYLLPAMYLGRHPDHKIIQASNTEELATTFARKVRNLVASEQYQKVFPGIALSKDSKAAHRWNTNKGGDYFAVGVSGSVAGHGANLCFAAGSMVMTDAGELPIEAIVGGAGKLALSYNFELHRTEWREIVGRASREEKEPLVRVQFNTQARARSFSCTKGHKVWAYKQGWCPAEYVPAGDLSPDDICGDYNGNPCLVVSVTEEASGATVYNITVEGNHNYYCEGILVKNCLIDDPHTDQDALRGMTNSKSYDDVYDWFTTGPRQRLQPNAAIVICMTRWSLKDLCAQILRYSSEKWEVIEFPAILPSGKALWPEFWPLEALEATKAEITAKGSLSKWNAQYQQNPTAEESSIIKRSWWNIWPSEEAPKCEWICQSWDTAFATKTHSDYSACTTWGVFYRKGSSIKRFYRKVDGQILRFDEEDQARAYDMAYKEQHGKLPQYVLGPDADDSVANIILLDAFRDKLEFTDLKTKALDIYKLWHPDTCIIEAKQAGAPLISEFRAAGIPVQDYCPTRGNDKLSRVNSVSDIFASGNVWMPDLSWAYEVMEEFASFPNGDHDDLVDSSTQALLRFRLGGFLRIASDEEEKRDDTPKRCDYYRC